MVQSIQRTFDRLDIHFVGRVKFSKIIKALSGDPVYAKIIEPFTR